MKTHLARYGIFAAATVGAFSLFMVARPAAQTQAPKPETPVGAPRRRAVDTTPVPRMPDGHPDFNGFYHGGTSGISNADEGEQVTTVTKDGSIFFDYGGANNGGQVGLGGAGDAILHPNDTPPYKPEYMAKQKQIAATVYGWISKLDPVLDCKPQGVPRSGIGGAIEIVQSAKAMAILYEDNPGPNYRIIYLDGRQHPTDLDTSYMGNSIGHWDGDTLVVDTVGLNDETWLGAPLSATIHSDKLHVIERWTRPGGKTIALATTVEDPVMFTKPWVMPVRRTVLGASDDYIQPEMCNTNDKAHIIEPSAKDQFKCNFCLKNPDAIYGSGASSSPSSAPKN